MSSAYQLFGQLVCDLDIEEDLATTILDRLVEADRLDDKCDELDKLNTTLSLECRRQKRKVRLLNESFDEMKDVVKNMTKATTAVRSGTVRQVLEYSEMADRHAAKAIKLHEEAQGE
ncbi:hypothetical protein MHBO_004536 [Bonamia ostreae]|uniref:Uncharacterized protein n=1 Tax=Bonamia ostreae TaxID=126728 RepID=A0ABV2AUD5_9EUKA